MSDPYIGQITMGALPFVPRGYSACNGISLPITQNQALYALIGFTYGGSGAVFNLPNLCGRTPIGYGAPMGSPTGLTVYTLGAHGGAESVALSAANLPSHNHFVNAGTATSAAALPSCVPGGVVLKSTKAALNAYAAPSNPSVSMHSKVAASEGGLPHSNLQPFLAINFFIALQGYFPPRD